MRGNEVQSLGITFRQSKRRRTDTSYDVGNLEEKGGPDILLEFSNGVHLKPGYDKAFPCFAHISRSTSWTSVKIGIVGKPRSWRIQRHLLQGIWIRTRRGRRELPGNNQGGLDKEYWCFPFWEAPF